MLKVTSNIERLFDDAETKSKGLNSKSTNSITYIEIHRNSNVKKQFAKNIPYQKKPKDQNHF